MANRSYLYAIDFDRTKGKRKTLALLFGLISIAAFGQTNYQISGFSDKYKGILTIEKGYEDEVFKKGEVSIIEIKTNKPLITIRSDELTFNLDEQGNVETNILEVPYEEQSVIICQDFNFDGKEDVAIMDGQFSCYHGPSFQVYLETEKGLKHSAEFTRLAQEYCGMFEIDCQTQTIRTMTKSGCCWHQFSVFKVKNNIPTEEIVIEEELSENGIIWDYTEKNRVGNRMVEKKYSTLNNFADIHLVYSLPFKNGKKMELYRASEGYLFYILKNEDKKIELFYSDDFIYDKKNDTLTFTNENTRYSVYPKGILINLPDKKIDMKAVGTPQNATLSGLAELHLDNVKIK